MLDQLRRDIQTRLDELLSETNRLRHALAALTSHDSATAAKANGSSSPTRSRRRASTTPSASTPSREPARAPGRTAARSTTSTASPKTATVPSKAASAPARTAPGTTKTAVLKALAGGSAMTASEVASATGLGRASVRTTLSKLAKSGDVSKAARGYQMTGQTTSRPGAGAAADAKDTQPVA